MRIVFGAPGFVSSPAGDRLRGSHPGWELVEAVGDAWTPALREADVAVPVAARVGEEQLAGAGIRLVQSPPARPSRRFASRRNRRAWAQFGVGLDVIDLAACRTHGVPVANVPSTVSANAVSVAEVALALVLDVARGIRRARAGIGAGGAPVPHALAGRTVLLVGLGEAIATRLAAFGVAVLATRAHPEQGGAPGVTAVHGADALDDLLPAVDGVVCCATPSGGPMFTAERLARFREGAFLVNVSRGIAVDEAALLAALDAGRIGGAGLDVLVHEPARADDPLVTHPRVVVTPHIGGATVENLLTSAEAVAANIERLERGEPLAWQVA